MLLLTIESIGDEISRHREAPHWIIESKFFYHTQQFTSEFERKKQQDLVWGLGLAVEYYVCVYIEKRVKMKIHLNMENEIQVNSYDEFVSKLHLPGKVSWQDCSLLIVAVSCNQLIQVSVSHWILEVYLRCWEGIILYESHYFLEILGNFLGLNSDIYHE